jgi:dTDP-4-amino-4,6-dideoxygalactose transaminase
LDPAQLGISRKKIVAALAAEGVPGISEGYAAVHLLPIYQKKLAYGKSGFPWNSSFYKGDVSYSKGICPTAERLHEETMVNLYFCKHFYTDREVDLVAAAFHKVWSHLEELR